MGLEEAPALSTEQVLCVGRAWQNPDPTRLVPPGGPKPGCFCCIKTGDKGKYSWGPRAPGSRGKAGLNCPPEMHLHHSPIPLCWSLSTPASPGDHAQAQTWACGEQPAPQSFSALSPDAQGHGEMWLGAVSRNFESKVSGRKGLTQTLCGTCWVTRLLWPGRPHRHQVWDGAAP